MTTRNDLPNIYEYCDYRLYLRDFYESQKKSKRCFSYRYFARKTGVPASRLKEITSGRRNMTLSILKKYASAMGLNSQQTNFFEILVLFGNAKKNDEKNRYFRKIVHLQNRGGIRLFGMEHVEFYQQWYHVAVRELVALKDFREDPAWIAHKLSPSITTAQAQKALDLLIENGLLRRNHEGRLIQADRAISSQYEMASCAVRHHHTHMIDLARKALDNVPIEKREISSLTLNIPRHLVPVFKERIRDFKEEVLGAAVREQQESEAVYQLNVQLFPLTDEREGGQSG